MNQVRTFLLFAWLLVGFLLWEAWQRDYAPSSPAASTTENTIAVAEPSVGLNVPGETAPSVVPLAPGDVEAPSAGDTAPASDPVVVDSDLLRLTFSPRGATVVRADLLEYGQTAARDAAPVTLLSDEPGRYFSAQAGWLRPDPQGAWQRLQTEQTAFQHQPRDSADPARIEVPFSWTDAATGLRLERTWVVQRGSYELILRDRWINGGTESIKLAPYREMLRQPPPSAGSSFTNPEAYSFVGAAWYSTSEKFNKIPFDDFDPKQPLNVQAKEGWIAMLQHYFFAAWIPPAGEVNLFSTAQLGSHYRVRAVGGPGELGPGAELTHESRLYVGPKLQEQLAGIAPGIQLTIDYGIFTLIAEPLFWLLSLFHSLTGNWGWAIILLVVTIKLLFFKLSETQYKSFAKMRMVQPRIESLKERYGDDRQKFNMAMMELYKKEKINPMGGCLPILVQIPVFISLYWVLLESVELRHAPWVGWIQNLTAPDPYFILPVLNLSTMVLTQKLSPTPGMDPLQKKMMQAMPLVFGVMFAFFPAGLVLYWTINGALGLLQQWVITRRHGGPAKPSVSKA